MSDALERFAALFKQRDNPPAAGIIIGEVIEPPPNFRVKIFDDVIIEKEQIILGSQWNVDYERTFEIIKGGEELSKFTDGKVKLNKTGETFNGVAEGVATFTTISAPSAPQVTTVTCTILDPMHEHDLNNGQEFAAVGTIKWTNTFKEGDELIIIPAINYELFYVIDKAVRFAE